MRHCCVGILAHVDAGKTTLCEALLYRSGKLKSMGRVDHGDTSLDTHVLERNRGITIFSAQAEFQYGETSFTLLDTPGHVDFSAEMERTLSVLDCAVLVISGSDGVQAHTETLWRLLEHYGLPTVLFVTKMDLQAADRVKLITELTETLSMQIMDFSAGLPAEEELAMCSEELMERYLDTGTLSNKDIQGLIKERKLFPCWFGSGLRLNGIEEFLEGLTRYVPAPESWPDAFGARVFRITRDARGERLTHVRLTGGNLAVRTPVVYMTADSGNIEEKITSIRIVNGARYDSVENVSPGEVCVLTGLSRSFAGQGLGFERDLPSPILTPALTYRIKLPEGVDDKTAMPKLKLLEEEDPQLHFLWNNRLHELQVQMMGKMQVEVLCSILAERFGIEVQVDMGHVQYKETIAAPVEGAGHYEPLRHYAEVHLLLEPLECGRGIEIETDCSTDELDLNWQRLILTHLAEKEHLGVLTGAPLTDVRITLITGRAHLKHTEGGDFRQATYRAVRQGLMKAQSILLEPLYHFRLEVPIAQTGRAISDLRSMHGDFSVESRDSSTVLEGKAPVISMRDYAAEVAAYTAGRGKLSCITAGYAPCHNTEEVIAAVGYDPEADSENSPDSVFCAHGAGMIIKWDRVDEYCHLESGLRVEQEHRTLRPRMTSLNIDERELETIMEREFGPIKRPMYTKAANLDAVQKKPVFQQKKELIIVDGYNVIFAWDELKAIAQDSLDTARSRLEEILINYRGFTGNEVVLVFDGYAVKGNPGEKDKLPGVRVVYTKENESADIYIEKLLHDIGRNYAVRVVTSDNLIRLSALGSGILRTSAREFGNEMDWVMSQIGAVLRRSSERSHMVKAGEGKL